MSEREPDKEIAVLGGGCFWCLEAVYHGVEGVTAVVPGYAGGNVPNPTYEQVESTATGHAQVVQASYRPDIISYSDMLDIFWVVHNPTTRDRQDYDTGPQYRSIILYRNDDQKQIAVSSKAAASKLWPDRLVTEIVPLEHFYEAEDYHHDYFKNHPDQAYCQIIINPKLKKLRDKFHSRLKDST